MPRTIAILLCLTLSPAFAQEQGSKADDPKRFLSVTKWSGRVQVTVEEDRARTTESDIFTSKVRGNLRGRVLLEEVSFNPGRASMLECDIKGDTTYFEENIDRARFPDSEGHILTRTTKVEAKGDAGGARFGLMIDASKGTYQVYLSNALVDGRMTMTCSNPPSSEGMEMPIPYGGLGDGLSPRVKLPARGKRLIGSVKVRAQVPIAAGGIVDDLYGKKPVMLVLQWSLYPAGEEDLEVVVTSAEYEDWMPKGDPSGTKAGNRVRFVAKLVTAEGAAAKHEKAQSFRFALTKVSEEPGICMNAGKGVTGKDLRFEQGENGKLEILDAGARAETKPGEQTEAEATVSSFDFGAWGTLQITAELGDGSVLPARLEGSTRPGILLPRRSPSSRIADKWKFDHGAAGYGDDEDEETDPVGDSFSGDGFTLYEEYRGFMENGGHIQANPQKKDLFVLCLGQAAPLADAIKLFRSLTGLEVHSRLSESEMDPATRLLNGLHGPRSPHVCDQHGIVIQPFAADAPDLALNVNEGDPHPGTPGEFKGIFVKPPGDDATWFKRSIVHEMLHCCSVKHHGELEPPEIDRRVRWTDLEDGYVNEQIYVTRLLANGEEEVLSKPSRVLVRREDGQKVTEADLPILKDPDAAMKLYLARQGGTHSGDEHCVMRYAAAQAYVPAGKPKVRYFVADKNREEAGMGLCDSPAGTGVNAPDHKPWPRYGNATIGNCKGQIRVKDVPRKEK